MDGELLVQAFGVVVAAIVAVSQIAYRLPRSRTKLKHDLEILNLLNENDPNFDIVKRSVDSSVADLYQSSSDKSKFKIYDWGDLVTGVILLFGGVLWIMYLVQDGFSWWSIFAGFLAIGGLGNLISAFEDESSTEAEKLDNSGT
jgi:hypothetical protein